MKEQMTEKTLYPYKLPWNNRTQMSLNPSEASDQCVCFYGILYKYKPDFFRASCVLQSETFKDAFVAPVKM